MSGGSSPKHETAPVALCERRGGPATYRRLDNLSHFLDCRPHDRLSSFIDQRQEYTGILPLEGSAGRIIGFWPVLHRKSASCRRRHSTTRVETGHLFLLPFRLRPSVEVDGCSGQRIVFRPIIVLSHQHFYKTAQSSSICDFYNNLENSIYHVELRKALSLIHEHKYQGALDYLKDKGEGIFKNGDVSINNAIREYCINQLS